MSVRHEVAVKQRSLNKHILSMTPLHLRTLFLLGCWFIRVQCQDDESEGSTEVDEPSEDCKCLDTEFVDGNSG